MRALSVFLCLLLALALPLPLAAQDPSCPAPDSLAGHGAIVGRVVDAETGIPLGFARVRVQIPGAEVPLEQPSNPSGRFKFCSVPGGAFTISAQLGQLGGFQGPLALEPGSTVQVSLPLAAAPEGFDTGTLTGVVVDADSGEPIEGATILLPEVGQTALTNALGRFTFPSLPPGEVSLQAARLGYAEATGAVKVERSRTVQTRVAMSTEPITMDPIVVTATRRRIRLPGLEDFERRFNSGWGRFILEDEIQVRQPRQLSDMLWDVGVQTFSNGTQLTMRRTGCAPLVYLDDIKLTRKPRGGGKDETSEGNQPGWYLWPVPDLNPASEAAWAVNLINPMDIVAVEVYRGPAETPGQYLDSNSRCGVILIWTRRGNLPRR